MMNPEIRDQWCAALESDEYKQGTGVLTRVNPDGTEEHCCLGVLADLAVKAGVVERIHLGPDKSVSYGHPDCNSAALPVAAIRRWAGLSIDNPDVRWTDRDGDEVEYPLAELNDGGGLKFPEIAKLIREQL